MEPETNYIKIWATNVCIIVVHNIMVLDINSKSTLWQHQEAYNYKIKNKLMMDVLYERL